MSLRVRLGLIIVRRWGQPPHLSFKPLSGGDVARRGVAATYAPDASGSPSCTAAFRISVSNPAAVYPSRSVL